MITPKDYLMGRDKEYPLSIEQALNMADLLARINHLFAILKIDAHVNSGYRPGKYNIQAGGSPKSNHLICKAIDIADPRGELADLFKSNLKLLEEYGLWMEDPSKTPGWVHLDTKERKNRIFKI
jgi:uncharacterized protein YcbK (DUF882 family)